MSGWARCLLILSSLGLAAAGCAAPSPSPRAGSQVPSQPTAPKRILAAVTSDLPSPRSAMSRASGGALPGAREVEQLVHAGLAVEDDRSILRAQLAEEVPSIENGLWRVLPDGRMETTWRIRPGARWHDGTPFTADDIVFTARLGQDKDIGVFRQVAHDLIDGVEALDSRTVLVRWSQLFIEADTMFSGFGNVQGVPMPKHLLEQAYTDNKAGFLNLPYWADEFVGAGPFRIREWASGSYMILEAFDGYVLGRPKVDEIEVRFTPDPTTLVAQILAGAVELPIGRGLSFEQAVQVRDRWREGGTEFTPGGAIKLWPQILNPTPAIVADVRFRRALYHAIDRQQLADTLMLGLSGVAHSVLIPTDREFADLDPSVVRYDYDPRRAVQILEGIGLSRGADGKYLDANGLRLVLELRATVIDVLQKTTLATAQDWDKVGITSELHTITPGRQSDREYRSTFPAFDSSRGNNSVETFKTFLSSEARTPANRFAGQNFPNYQNAELDGIINRYLVSIPLTERTAAGKQVVHHLSDQVTVMPVFYDVLGTMTGRRMVNVGKAHGQSQTRTWNAHEWDVQ